MPRSQKPRGRPRSALPAFIPPELATLVDAAPEGPEWLHEMKLDGYRMAARMAGGKVALLTRHALDWTVRFGPIATALAGLPARAAYLDGEVAVVGEDGVTSFASLQDALSRSQTTRLTYHLFDILHLDGSDLTGLPLSERKQILSHFLGPQPAHPLRYSDHVQGQGRAFFEQACRLGLEGVVSKLASSPYRSRRTAEWQKIKCLQRQEFVIGGWQESDKKGRSLRSLLLGYYDRAGALVFAGKAGTGFALRLGHELVAQLRQMERPDPPFAAVPRPYQRGARWAEPRLVAEIVFSNWTTDKLLRHPSFEALREDKPAREVGLEQPVSPKRAAAKRTTQRPSPRK
jgi:bifunctional non-homologous end joining protein LigD